MRIDNAQFTGSATGTTANAVLTGSFTGSGHIDRANTASRLEFSASFGLGIENTFNYDGSSNQAISIDTASAHFIAGVESASIDNAETGSFLITSSISASGELLITKGDGTVYSESIIANSTRANLNSGLGTLFSSYNGSVVRAVNVDTSSAHFIQGVSAQTGSLVRNVGIAGTDENMVITYGDGTTATIPVVSSSYAVTASHALNAVTSSYFEGVLTNATASSIRATGSFQGDLDGTASIASKVENALTNGALVDAFTYDGSATATVNINTYSGSASTARDVAASQVSGSSTAPINNLSGSASAARDIIVSKISGSSDALSGSASAARDIIVSKISGSSDALSGSASAARDALVADISGSSNALSASASTARDLIVANISGSSNALSASASTARDVLVASISGSNNALSASASTARDVISNAVSGAFQATSASFSTSQTNLSASNSTAREAYVSGGALLAGREEDTIRLTRGNGSVDDVTFVTSSFVKTVNTTGPDAQGNVAISLASVRTGTSSSMLAYSSSGNFQDGDVWVLSGQSGSSPTEGSASNGVTFIYAATGSILLEIASLTEIAADSKYVNTSGDTMTGNLVLPAANPTLANEATRKGYVDLFYDSSSLDRPNAELELHKGNGTVDIISLAGISVSSSVSASNVGVANGRRITATTNPTQNFITLNDGASNAEIGAANNLELNMNTDGGAIGQIDFQNNGTSVATIDQDGTASFAFVASTASSALSVEHRLSNGALVDAFSYNGDQPATINISTYSASVATTVSTAAAQVSGSSTAPISSLSGSASTARDIIVSKISGSSDALSGSASAARDIIVSKISGSSDALSGSASAARDALVADISGSSDALSGSASTSRTLLANQKASLAGATMTGATITGTFTGNLTGTASFAGTASGLHPGATIATTGDITGTATNFDGSGPISIPTTIANDVVDYATLGAEFTTRDTTTATALDFNSFAVFDRTLTANTTFTFTNLKIGDVKYLVLDCAGFTPTFPGTMTTVGGGTIDTTSGTDNVISIFSPDGTNTFATILQ